MTIRLLLPILLVLLQAGLTAHARVHTSVAHHTKTTHVHVHDLLNLHGHHHDHDTDGDDEGDTDNNKPERDHESDAVQLSDMVGTAPPAASDLIALDLVPTVSEPVFASSTEAAFATGLPPSTAGPSRPLYLTFRTLII